MIGVDWLLQWHNYAILHELGAMFLWSDALPGANHAKCLERAVYACLSRFHTRHIGPVAYTFPSVASYGTLGRWFHYSDPGGMGPR